MLTSPAARRLSSLAVLLLALLGSVALAAPASAAEKVVEITAEGLRPAQLTIARGDTVVVVNQDEGFRYRVRSTSDNWDFDSGLLTPLARGQRYELPPVEEVGTYTFTAFQGEDPFNGAVVLPAPSATTPPAAAPASPGASPRPGATTAPGASPAATPSPAATGGTGAAALPPLAGGFGSTGVLPSAAPVPGQAPAVAPALPGLPTLPGDPAAGPEPQTAGEPTPAPVGAQAIAGDLPGAQTPREYGLPAALAAVLAVGVVSLLVRLLLAEPAAQRRVRGLTAGLGGPDPVVTVD